MITRVSRELERPCRLHRDCRLEPRLTNSRLIRSLRPRLAGTKNGTERWYRQAKETKCGEMGGKESEHPVVVLKQENGLPDPVERRGCRVVDGKLEPRRGRRASSACHREPTRSCEGQRSAT